MAAAVGGRATWVRRLRVPQGVLTILGSVTGIAAICLPFALVCPKPICVAIGIVALFFDQFETWVLFLLAPFLLPIAISVGYLRWLLTGELASWAWRTGYALAVLMGVAAVLGFGSLALSEFDLFDTPTVAGTLSLLVSLSLGSWLVMRNRRVDIPQALNALMALQVVYAAGTLPLLLSLMTDEPDEVLVLGGWLALFTVVVYVVQMVLGSRRPDARNYRPGLGSKRTIANI